MISVRRAGLRDRLRHMTQLRHGSTQTGHARNGGVEFQGLACDLQLIGFGLID
jgi:hypothetical protein